MADTWLLLLAASSLVLVGFLAAQVFDRFRFPDYFILMAIGLVIGSGILPLGGVDPRSSLESIAPVLTSVALAFILFEGGLVLRVRGMGRLWGVAMTHTFVAMVLAIGGMWLVGTRLLGLAPTTALILALAFSGPSATIVLSFLPSLNVVDRTRFTLTVEGVIGNVVAAVLVIFLVRFPTTTAAGSGAWLGYAASVAFAVLIAWILGELWVLAVGGAKPRSFTYMASVAVALLLYAIGEGLLGGTGGIAAFVFGLVLGHRKFLSSRSAAAHGSAGTRGFQEFHREVVFVLRTFFFLYLGIQVQLAGITLAALLGAVVFTGVFFLSRFPSAGLLAWSWRLPRLDRRVLGATVARGMTDTVLILFAIEARAIPPQESTLVTNLLFLVILVAAMASAVFVFRAELLARRAPAPAPSPPAGPAPAAGPSKSALPRDLDHAIADFLADPIVQRGEID